MESKIDGQKMCFLCGSAANLERHHCLHGSGRRKLAEEDGLWVWLCRYCHNEIHFGQNSSIPDRMLIEAAQVVYEKNHTRKEFIERYGKNWL